jgi:hypothetical protein
MGSLGEPIPKPTTVAVTVEIRDNRQVLAGAKFPYCR